MTTLLQLISNQRVIGAILLLLGVAVLILPLTYYGYIDYVINNSVSQLSSNDISLDLKNAAIHLYNGHPIKEMNTFILIGLSIIGSLFIYVALFFITNKASKLKLLITKKYWQEFKLLP